MPITDALPEMKRDLQFFPVKNNNPKILSPDQIKFFNKNGYLCPLDIFSPQEADANRLFFEELMERAREEGYNSYSINGWQRYCEGIYDLAMNPKILDYAEDIIGETLICEMTHFFCKMPGDYQRVSWHQDASYWPLTPSKVVTIWLAIDDVDEENGPMTVIPGSHKHGQIPFENSTEKERNVLGQTVLQAEKWGGHPVPFVLKAGQISMHTDLLLHGSEPNQSHRRRCGLTIRYLPPDVRSRYPEYHRALICRGEDKSGYWRQLPRPVGNIIPPRK